MMLPRCVRLALAAAALLAGSAAPAGAQGGYTKDSFPDLGLELQRARDYEQVPLSPDSEWFVLHYVEKELKNPEQRKELRPELFVVWIDWIGDQAPNTGVQAGSPPAAQGAEKPPQPAEEHPKLPINSFERYAAEHLGKFDLGKPEPGREREGERVSIVELKSKKTSELALRGLAYVVVKPQVHTIVLLGMCAPSDFKEQAKIWRYMGEHLEVSTPESADLAKLRRKYGHSKLRGLDYRVGVRSKLVRGWEAEDTENFIVVYHTPDQPLVRKILGDLEILRAEYARLFPAVQPIEAVSTVRICRDRDEYLLYGGSPQTAGYWNWATEELVLYDATLKEKGKRPQVEGTFFALYHEAFHQYIHYSTGELPPHSWFNEGTGDFFSGARISGGKLHRIGIHPWRASLIREAVQLQVSVPWREILRFEQPQYYENGLLHYAQGWSMIYFLRTSKQVAQRPDWQRILPVYFEQLKACYAEELAKLDPEHASDEEPRFEAGRRARKRALDKAIEGVDLDELEAAWKQFVRELPDD